MTKLDPTSAFDVPAHYGDMAVLPCFACFLEEVLEAAGDVYDDDGPDAYDLAMANALRQMADGIGAMLAVLTPDSPVMRDAFIARLTGAMLLEDANASGAAH